MKEVPVGETKSVLARDLKTKIAYFFRGQSPDDICMFNYQIEPGEVRDWQALLKRDAEEGNFPFPAEEMDVSWFSLSSFVSLASNPQEATSYASLRLTCGREMVNYHLVTTDSNAKIRGYFFSDGKMTAEPWEKEAREEDIEIFSQAVDSLSRISNRIRRFDHLQTMKASGVRKPLETMRNIDDNALLTGTSQLIFAQSTSSMFEKGAPDITTNEQDYKWIAKRSKMLGKYNVEQASRFHDPNRDPSADRHPKRNLPK